MRLFQVELDHYFAEKALGGNATRIHDDLATLAVLHDADGFFVIGECVFVRDDSREIESAAAQEASHAKPGCPDLSPDNAVNR